MTGEALKALAAISDAIVETVAEFPDGAPAGPMYMAFASVGITLDQFNALIALLVAAGRVKQRGHCLYPA